VATDTLGKSGRAMLEALVDGTLSPAAMADLARGRMREKIPQLEQALAGSFAAHQRFLVARQLAHIDSLDVDAVRREFSVAEMARLGVYKVHPEEHDDEVFAEVLGYVCEFADYCRSAAGRRLDLITTLF